MSRAHRIDGAADRCTTGASPARQSAEPSQSAEVAPLGLQQPMAPVAPPPPSGIIHARRPVPRGRAGNS